VRGFPRAVVLLAVALACACGDEGGGCGGSSEPKSQEAPAAGGGASPGGGSRADTVEFADRKSRVPKAYRRPDAAGPADDGGKAEPPAASSAPAQAAPQAPRLPPTRVLRRGVDGIKEREELTCRVAAGGTGECRDSKDFPLIQETCCPAGTIERCRFDSVGVVIVGRGCGAR
jgi:hypothetical protein